MTPPARERLGKTRSRNGSRWPLLVSLASTLLVAIAAWVLRMEGRTASLERFEMVGPRFTQDDGDALDRRLDQIEAAVRVLEDWRANQPIPPPEVEDALNELRRRLDRLERVP